MGVIVWNPGLEDLILHTSGYNRDIASPALSLGCIQVSDQGFGTDYHSGIDSHAARLKAWVWGRNTTPPPVAGALSRRIPISGKQP